MMGGIIPFWCARSSRFGGRLGSESANSLGVSPIFGFVCLSAGTAPVLTGLQLGPRRLTWDAFNQIKERTPLLTPILISYSVTDKGAADAVCHRLEGARIRCWIAPRDVGFGKDG
jgi:hypothetical protein